MPEDSTILSKNMVKRLIRDIRSITTDPLTDHGIYYTHSDSDILKGQALIIGPAETPYHHGFYLFDFEYPSDYPHQPPVVKFRTNDGVTRMNPNLYKCGKVCVSILNTWRGDAWTGCQTISTILLTLVSLLNSTPFLNEPGITEDHQDYASYNQIIQYKNYDTAIYNMLTSSNIKAHFSNFIPKMQDYFIDNYRAIDKRLKELSRELKRLNLEPQLVRTGIFRMHIVINYTEIRQRLSSLYKKLTKLK